jgi:hypothetical protein
MENWCLGRRGRFADVHKGGNMGDENSRLALVVVARSKQFALEPGGGLDAYSFWTSSGH